MIKMKSRFVLLGAFGAVAFSLGAGSVAVRGVNAQAAAESKPVTSTTENANSAPGAVIAIDPATGKTRIPEPSEIIALQNSKAAKAKTEGKGEKAPVTYALPGGGVAIVADPSMDCSMVVTKKPDGKLKTDCVTGQQNADAIVNSKSINTAKEQLDEK